MIPLASIPTAIVLACVPTPDPAQCAAILASYGDSHTITVELSDRYQGTGLGEAIQVYTVSPFNHVDFVLPGGNLLGATPGGVRIRSYTGAPITRRMTFQADPVKVIGFALQQLGKPYDFAGNAGYATHLHFIHQPGTWFCSRLVARSAMAGAVKLTPSEWASPAQIAASPLLTKTTTNLNDN